MLHFRLRPGRVGDSQVRLAPTFSLALFLASGIAFYLAVHSARQVAQTMPSIAWNVRNNFGTIIAKL